MMAKAKRSVKTAETAYINTDLEIRSKQDLAPLVEALSDLFNLYHGKIKGRHFASFEIFPDQKNPDKTINLLCDRIERLPKKAKSIWRQSDSRVFDIGYESGTAPQCFQFALKEVTVKRVAKFGATIAISIYGSASFTKTL